MQFHPNFRTNRNTAMPENMLLIVAMRKINNINLTAAFATVHEGVHRDKP